jgi:hypothetical protein
MKKSGQFWKSSNRFIPMIIQTLFGDQDCQKLGSDFLLTLKIFQKFRQVGHNVKCTLNSLVETYQLSSEI